MNPLLDKVSGTTCIPVDVDDGGQMNGAVALLRERLFQYIQHCVGPREHLTLEEVASICKVSVSHIQTLLKRKEIPCFDTSSLVDHVKRRRKCVTSNALAEFLEKQEDGFLSYILGDPLNGRARHVDEGLDTK